MSGVGKRFVDAGYNDPKPLILVEGKPIIQHVVELFPGETDITFICNDLHLRETNMRETLLSIVPTCKIIEVSVENRRGPVDAVLQAIQLQLQLQTDNSLFENEEIIVSYCDYGTQWDYSAFLKNMRENNMDGGIACYIGFHPHMLGSDNYAFLSVVEGGSGSDSGCIEMTAIQEKQPFTDNKMNEYASNGTYYFRNVNIMKTYFERLVERNICVNNEFYVSMVYNLMREDNLRIGVFKIDKMLQWGTPKDLEEYLVWSDYFLKRDTSFNCVDVDVDRYVTLILPMAGAGSRFFNVGYSTPKPLLDVEGLPMVVQAVKCLPPTNKKIFICQKSHLEEYPIAETLLNHFKGDDVSVIDIDYITEGQACTCELAFNNACVNENNVQIPDDKPVMISACDNGVYYDMQKYLDVWTDPAVDIIIWSFSNNPTSLLYPHMYAWLDVDESGFIKRVSIKKPFTDCDAKHCIIGTMVFKKARYFKEGLDLIYSGNLRTNGEFYVDNMIEPLIEKGYRCKIFDVTNYLCWGTPNDYKTYQYWYEYFCKPK